LRSPTDPSRILVVRNITRPLKKAVMGDGLVSFNIGVFGGDSIEVAPLDEKNIIHADAVQIQPIGPQSQTWNSTAIRLMLRDICVCDGMIIPLQGNPAMVHLTGAPMDTVARIDKDTSVMVSTIPASVTPLPYSEFLSDLDMAFELGFRALMVRSPDISDLIPVIKAWALLKGLNLMTVTGIEVTGAQLSKDLSNTVVLHTHTHMVASYGTITGKEVILHTLLNRLRERARLTIALTEARLNPLLKGVFDQEIQVHLPDVPARRDLLRIFSLSAPIPDGNAIVQAIAGQSIHDARVLLKYALRLAQQEMSDEAEVPPALTVRHIDQAIEKTYKGMGFIRPNIDIFRDIGGYAPERVQFLRDVALPFINPERAVQVWRVSPLRALVIFGPPGGGKTYLVKAFASIGGIRFRHVAPQEILSKYIGESEKNLYRIFDQARQHAPSVLFFDEIEALVPSREKLSTSEAGGQAKQALVSAMLQLVDGMDSSHGVLVIGNTNRISDIDDAFLNRGQVMYFRPPTDRERKAIYLAQFNTKGIITEQFTEDQWQQILAASRDFVARDIESAVTNALRRRMSEGMVREVKTKQLFKTAPPLRFEELLASVRDITPTLTPSQLKEYERQAKSYCGIDPTRVNPDAAHWYRQLEDLRAVLQPQSGTKGFG